MSATTVLAAAGVCPPGVPRAGWVAFADGVITEIGDGRPPRGAHDLGDRLLVPGYVDLQVNGLGSVDFATARAEDWERAGAALLSHGVTAFCPTFVTAPLDAYDSMLASARAAAIAARSRLAPDMLGVHLEGPFLGGAPGAHSTELICAVDLAWLSDLLERHGDVVRIVTLAPEADPDFAGIALLRGAGVTVALGHSLATYDQAIAAADAGARLVTHLYNGMSPLHHRDPGLVGAALDDDRFVATVIADLVHVHPAALRVAIHRKDGIALVSDVVAETASMHPHDGAVRLRDGTLAGASMLIDGAVANVVGLGIPVDRAISLATQIPCDAMGLEQHGRLAAGARADLLALDADSLDVLGVWCAGRAAAGLARSIAATTI